MKFIYNWIQNFLYHCFPYSNIDKSDAIPERNNKQQNHHIIDIDKKDYNLLTPNMLKQGIVGICKQN